MIGNFSILLSFNIFSALSKSLISVVIKLLTVMISLIGSDISFWKRKSRLVTIPTSLFWSSTIGIPPILFSFINLNASATDASTVSVIGSKIIPLSDLLTFLTSRACLSMDIFLCKTPIPPSWAIAIAILDSVTVSIAADTIGIFNLIFFEKFVEVLTYLGKTSEYAGITNTSS